MFWYLNVHSLPLCGDLLLDSAFKVSLSLQMGKLKRRIRPSDITINIGKGAPIPECPIPGERFDFFLTPPEIGYIKNIAK